MIRTTRPYIGTKCRTGSGFPDPQPPCRPRGCLRGNGDRTVHGRPSKTIWSEPPTVQTVRPKVHRPVRSPRLARRFAASSRCPIDLQVDSSSIELPRPTRLSVIPLQRAGGIVHDGSHDIQYSDYFDFYPWVYHEGHKHLVCNTPAQVSLHEVRVFRGQTSPILSPLDFDHKDTDNPLLTALLERWRIRYGTKRPQWSDRALFRSLNMAAAASKMPAGVDLTTFSLGRNIGLWVSAFEILTHTAQARIRFACGMCTIASVPLLGGTRK
jgi:hypothetical protein